MSQQAIAHPTGEFVERPLDRNMYVCILHFHVDCQARLLGKSTSAGIRVPDGSAERGAERSSTAPRYWHRGSARDRCFRVSGLVEKGRCEPCRPNEDRAARWTIAC